MTVTSRRISPSSPSALPGGWRTRLLAGLVFAGRFSGPIGRADCCDQERQENDNSSAETNRLDRDMAGLRSERLLMTTNIRRLGQKSSTLFTFFGANEGGHHTIFILRFPAVPSRTVARPGSRLAQLPRPDCRDLAPANYLREITDNPVSGTSLCGRLLNDDYIRIGDDRTGILKSPSIGLDERIGLFSPFELSLPKSQ
jgi:hypothetical protein